MASPVRSRSPPSAATSTCRPTRQHPWVCHSHRVVIRRRHAGVAAGLHIHRGAGNTLRRDVARRHFARRSGLGGGRRHRCVRRRIADTGFPSEAWGMAAAWLVVVRGHAERDRPPQLRHPSQPRPPLARQLPPLYRRAANSRSPSAAAPPSRAITAAAGGTAAAATVSVGGDPPGLARAGASRHSAAPPIAHDTAATTPDTLSRQPVCSDWHITPPGGCGYNGQAQLHGASTALPDRHEQQQNVSTTPDATREIREKKEGC